jgi:HEAT repeat protein
VFLRTEQIFPGPADERLRTLVSALASLSVVKGRHVWGDNPGQAAFGRLRARATDEQIVGLAFHENRIVRGYFAPGAIALFPARCGELAPLLRDATLVDTLDYDLGATASIGSLALDAFLELPHSTELDLVLEQAVDDDAVDPYLRARALEAWAHRHRAAARRIAQAWLDVKASVMVREAVGLLGELGDVGSAPAIAELAEHEASEVRGEVAVVLAQLGYEEAEPLVSRLARSDVDRQVRARAAGAYVRLARRKGETVDALLADPDANVVGAAAAALLAEPLRAEDLDLFERFVLAHPDDAPVPDLPRGPFRPRVLALLDDWLDDCGDSGPKAEIIARLAEGRHRASTPKIRAALTSESIQVRMSAAAALATLKDPDAVGPLEKLLESDDNPHGRIAAAKALVALRSKRSASVVQKVAGAEATWARDELLRLAADLAK